MILPSILLLQVIGGLALTDVPAECGIKNTVKPLISYATETGSEYPWHAGLYKDFGRSFLCGGNIITDKAILTAANCVYNESTNEPVPTDDLRVAVGKLRRSWGDSETNEQRFKVKSIFMPDTYFGYNNRYADDIAVLLLDGTINITPKVMPVCIDWHNKYTVKANDLGTVVGWGITESGKPSDLLRMAELPYYNFRSCRKVNTRFSQFITSDKFCAGLLNGTHLAGGDAGGGITFPAVTKRHFLHGIASVTNADEPYITGFTNVTYHVQWLAKVLTAIKRSG